MNEVKEKVFRYPNDISRKLIKSTMKIILVVIGIVLSLIFIIIFSDPLNWRIVNKGEMILTVSIAIFVVSLLFGIFSFLLNLAIGSSLKTTEIIINKNNLTRRIKDEEKIFNWDGIAKVRVNSGRIGRIIQISKSKRKHIFIFPEIERFDELISMIREKVPEAIFKEKKRSLLEYAFCSIPALIFAGVYVYVPLLRPILYIILMCYILAIFFLYPMSSIYGSKGKWFDWIIRISCIYSIIKSIVKL